MARAILLALAAVFQADAVVTRGDVAVGNAHILRMVEVDAIAIAYLQVVEQLDAVDHSTVAAHEMHGPIGALCDGNVANNNVLHVGQRKHVRTGVERRVLERLQLVRVVEFGTHETNAVAVNGATSGDGDILCIVRPKPQHSLTAILAKGAELIDTLIGIGLQHRRGL